MKTPLDFLPAEAHENSVLNTVALNINKYKQLIQGASKAIWKTELVNDLRRISQGVFTNITTGKKTFIIIHLSKIPGELNITYIIILAIIHPQKSAMY